MAKIAIIGGGIIGVSIAVELLGNGHDLTIFEPDEAGTGAAAGSAGYLSAGEIFPLARPGVLAELPQMLLNPLGPLVIRASYAPRMLEWGMRFLGATRKERVQHGIRALASLNRDANDAAVDMAQRAGCAELIDRRGGLHVCAEQATVTAVGATVETLRESGIDAQMLSTAELSRLEPALAPGLAGALFLPGDARCCDPHAFGVRLAGYARAHGTTIRKERVLSIKPDSDGTWQLRLAGESVHIETVIVAGGVWSRDLLTPLGYRVPIETERGYHLMLSNPSAALIHPIVFEEPHFAATTMNHGLRLAGTVEFGGTQAPMNPRRADILARLVERYLPGLTFSEATRWMGFRPSFPDSLPAIGTASKHRNLLYCFGHQHLGLTQAAISARCIADLVAMQEPRIDLRPFSLGRFAA